MNITLGNTRHITAWQWGIAVGIEWAGQTYGDSWRAKKRAWFVEAARKRKLKAARELAKAEKRRRRSSRQP